MFHPDETVSVQSVSRKLKQSKKWYGRTPATVLLDPRLDSLAIHLFGILSLQVFQGNVSYIGMRLLGTLTGKSAATVMRRLKKLEAYGYIAPYKPGAGKRSYYVLTHHPIFGQKQAAGVREIAASPSGGQRLVSAPRRKAS